MTVATNYDDRMALIKRIAETKKQNEARKQRMAKVRAQSAIVKKKAKKEGRMKYNEVLKEANRLGEMAKKKIETQIYERAIEERKKAMMVSEDESLAEFINQEAIKEVKKEISELEKKKMAAEADYNTMKK